MPSFRFSLPAIDATLSPFRLPAAIFFFAALFCLMLPMFRHTPCRLSLMRCRCRLMFTRLIRYAADARQQRRYDFRDYCRRCFAAAVIFADVYVLRALCHY